MAPAIEGVALQPLAGAVPAWRAEVDATAWRGACAAVAAAGGRLGTLWASDERDRRGGFAVHALLVAHEGLVCLQHPLQGTHYPDLSDLFPSAARMQRAMRDLTGL